MRIICLAKSRRPGGYCVAGKELMYGRIGSWIRPIGSGEDDAVDPALCVYGGNQELRLLDIVELNMFQNRPSGHQTENWTFDESDTFKRMGSFRRDQVSSLVDGGEQTLWSMGFNTTAGCNDVVPTALASGFSDSLRLIRVSQLVLKADDYPSGSGARRRIQGRFEYNGNEYALWVTDVDCVNFYAGSGKEERTFSNRYLAISLTLPFNLDTDERCYKLIAGII